MTQLQWARKGITTGPMREVALSEGLPVEFIMAGVSSGEIVIPLNSQHQPVRVCGIGHGLRTKVNANVGTSSDIDLVNNEIKKTEMAVKHGADTVMDLSTGSNLKLVRKAVLNNCLLPFGTVPIYQAALESREKYSAIVNMKVEDFFNVIEEQASEGVDFMTVHAGINNTVLTVLKNQKRLMDVVSRGGAFTIAWMLHNDRENPAYEYFDRLLGIALKYDVTLSLGDGMRPGCLADATDRVQVSELIVLGELVERAREAGVQVMVEGPGHLPLHEIVANVRMQKSICKKAPFYVLGPLVTDIGAGYDHITGAIGGAIAAAAGADFICYVTPSEHISLPDLEDVRVGVIAARLAAHAADISKGIKGASSRDRDMSLARKKLDWEEQARLSLDTGRFREIRNRHLTGGHACTMCGDYCAMELIEKYLGITTLKC